MLREGLAAEFPSAKHALDQVAAAIRSARVSREAPLWAALSAFGAGWAVGAIGQVLGAGLRVAGFRDPASWLTGGLAILGYALAIAVALRAGGGRGLAWYFAILALRIGLQISTALPGFLTFCERSGGNCSAMQFVVPYLYLAAGLVVSVAAVRLIRAGPPSRNVFLSGAGVFTLLGGVIGLTYVVVRPQDAVAISAMDILVSGAPAVAAGVVLRVRSPRIGPAAALAAAIALSWLAFSGPFIVSVLREGAGSQPASVYVSGLTAALGVGLGWLAATAVQRARATAAA